MNNKIKEVIKEVGTDVSGKWVSIANVEKIVQMIILQCTTVLQDGTREADHYAQRIEEHFDNSTNGVLRYRDK